MLKLTIVALFAAILTTQIAVAAPAPSQQPSQGGHKQSAQDNRGTEQRPLVVETRTSPQSQAEADQDATYKQQKAAIEDAHRLGTTAIWVGLSQTFALVITFWVMAYVAVRQLRAYVYPELTLSNFAIPKRIEVLMTMINSGVTPARDLEQHSACFVAVLPLPDNVKAEPKPKEDHTGRHSKVVVYPGLPHHCVFECMDEIGGEIVSALRQPEPAIAIYVHGVAKYRDIFGLKRVTEFCSYISPEDVVAMLNAVEGKGPEFALKDVRFVSAHVRNRFT